VSTASTATPFEWTDLDKRAVDTVRALAMDAVQNTGNGHPGRIRHAAADAGGGDRLLRHGGVGNQQHDSRDEQWNASGKQKLLR